MRFNRVTHSVLIGEFMGEGETFSGLPPNNGSITINLKTGLENIFLTDTRSGIGFGTINIGTLVINAKGLAGRTPIQTLRKRTRPASVLSDIGIGSNTINPEPIPINPITVKLELLLDNRVIATGSSFNFLSAEIIACSDRYQLRITNVDRNRPVNNFILEINYMTIFPIVRRVVPMRLFQNAFDSVWNNRTKRYAELRLIDSRLYIYFDEEFARIYGFNTEETISFNSPFQLGIGKIDFQLSFGPVDPLISFPNDANTKVPAFILTIILTDFEIDYDLLGIIPLVDIDLRRLDIVIRYRPTFGIDHAIHFDVDIPLLDTLLRRLGNITDSRVYSFKKKIEGFILDIHRTVTPVTPEISSLLYYWLVGKAGDTAPIKITADQENMYIDFADDTPVESSASPDTLSDWSSQPLDISPLIRRGVHLGEPTERRTATGSVSNPGPILRAPANSEKVNHIVVLMMENRSFDHMLGYLSLVNNRQPLPNRSRNIAVDGLRGNEFNMHNGFKYTVNHLTNTKILEGPAHETEDIKGHQMLPIVNEEYTMKGFVDNYARRYRNANIETLSQVMGYYKATEVPVYDYLARNFAVCDRWFCSHPGPTLTNRFIALTGDVIRNKDGGMIENHPTGRDFLPIEIDTLFDHLSRSGFSWNYFEHKYCTLRMFGKYTFDTEHILGIEKFHKMAASGTLPTVSFIDPDYIDFPPGNDDHPPADIRAGQKFINTIIHSLQNSPAWEKTMLIITYDENGGFYDHVPPPKAVAISNGESHYGPRVPAIVVSPFIPNTSGEITVDHTVYDHCSIAATILRKLYRRDIPDMGPRIKQANDFWHLLSLRQARRITNAPTLTIPTTTPNPIKYKLDPIDDGSGFHHLVLTGSFFIRS